MRKIIYMFLMSVLVCTTSCLDKFPDNAVSESKAITTVEEANQAVIGIYSSFLSSSLYSGYLTLLPDVQCDLVYAVNGYSNNLGEIWRWDILATNSQIEAVYGSLYGIIGNCNFLLDNAAKLMPTLVDDDDIDFTIELIKKHALGCVQLPAHKRDIVKRVTEAADYPLLVFNDTEQGFPTSSLPPIPLMSLSACGREEYYRAFARAVARDAREAGFNGTWGPVIDVLRDNGPCRVYRHFSDDPETVAKAAEVIAEVYKKNRYLSTGKHYPGGHDCPYDSHMTEGYSEQTPEELLKTGLYPYIKLM